MSRLAQKVNNQRELNRGDPPTLNFGGRARTPQRREAIPAPFVRRGCTFEIGRINYISNGVGQVLVSPHSPEPLCSLWCLRSCTQARQVDEGHALPSRSAARCGATGRSCRVLPDLRHPKRTSISRTHPGRAAGLFAELSKLPGLLRFPNAHARGAR